MKKLLLSLVATSIAFTVCAQEFIDLNRGAWPYIIFRESGTLQARIQGTNGKFVVTSADGATNHFIVNTTTGDVGIGQPSLIAKLNVYNPGSQTRIVIGNPNTSSGGYTGLQFGTSADTGGYTYFQAIKSSGSSYGNIIFNASGGSVGIGTANPGSFKLAVEGKIGAREVRVTQTSSWSDFVFYDDYMLTPLEQVDAYIKKNKKLEDIPSAKEVETNGYDLGNMDALLLQKVEETVLYLIQQNKQLLEQSQQILELKKQILEQEKRLLQLEQQNRELDALVKKGQ